MGAPGSGKTYLAEYFKKRGVNAYDADKVNGLGKWVDKKGKPAKYVHSEVDEKWLSKHDWIWSSGRLRSLIKSNKELFLFGTASNIYKFVDLFDSTYYLKASRRLISNRLQDTKRVNWHGKSKVQREGILSRMKQSHQRALKAGIEFVEASLPPKQIFDIILSKTKRQALIICDGEQPSPSAR